LKLSESSNDNKRYVYVLSFGLVFGGISLLIYPDLLVKVFRPKNTTLVCIWLLMPNRIILLLCIISLCFQF